MSIMSFLTKIRNLRPWNTDKVLIVSSSFLYTTSRINLIRFLKGTKFVTYSEIFTWCQVGALRRNDHLLWALFTIKDTYVRLLRCIIRAVCTQLYFMSLNRLRLWLVELALMASCLNRVKASSSEKKTGINTQRWQSQELSQASSSSKISSMSMAVKVKQILIWCMWA